jgi:hypothetical protein
MEINELPRPLTAEQIKDFEERRKKSDDRLMKGGAVMGEDGRLKLTDAQMADMQRVNIGAQCRGIFNGIDMCITMERRNVGQHCLQIGNNCVWDVGKTLKEVKEVFEFAKTLAKAGEDAETVYKKTEKYVEEREMEAEKLNSKK